MLNSILCFLFFFPIILGLWLAIFNLLKLTLDGLGIDITDLFNRKVVDIPDFVNVHRNSEIEYLFNERRKNDNEIQI